MPTLGEVVLPVLAGLASAASPYAARGIGAGLEVHEALKRRRRQAAEQVAEQARQARLAQVLQGQTGDDPYTTSARALAGAGAIEPALGLFAEGVRLRARQNEDQAERLRKAMEPAAPRERRTETRTEEDPATGQKYRQRYVDGVPDGPPVPVYKPPPVKVERPEKPDPDEVPRSSYTSDDGYHVEVLWSPRTGKFREQKLGKVRMTAPGERGVRIRSVDENDQATVELPTGEVQRMPTQQANEVVRVTADEGVPLLTRMGSGNVAAASPARPVAPAVRKQFRNARTGRVELFELRSGSWVPVR